MSDKKIMSMLSVDKYGGAIFSIMGFVKANQLTNAKNLSELTNSDAALIATTMVADIVSNIISGNFIVSVSLEGQPDYVIQLPNIAESLKAIKDELATKDGDNDDSAA